MKNSLIAVSGVLLGAALAAAAWSVKIWPFEAPDLNASGRSLGFALPAPAEPGFTKQEQQISELSQRYAENRSLVLAEVKSSAARPPLEADALDELIRRDAKEHPIDVMQAVMGQIKPRVESRYYFDWALLPPHAMALKIDRKARNWPYDTFLSPSEKWARIVVTEWAASDPEAALAWLRENAPVGFISWVGSSYARVNPMGAMAALDKLDDPQKGYFIAGLLIAADSLPDSDLKRLRDESTRLCGIENYELNWDRTDALFWEIFDPKYVGMPPAGGLMSRYAIAKDDCKLALRQWVRRDGEAAQSFMSQLKPGPYRLWLEMQVGLKLNDDDLTRTNAWLLGRHKHLADSGMVLFWELWSLEDVESFSAYRANAPEAFLPKLKEALFITHGNLDAR